MMASMSVPKVLPLHLRHLPCLAIDQVLPLLIVIALCDSRRIASVNVTFQSRPTRSCTTLSRSPSSNMNLLIKFSSTTALISRSDVWSSRVMNREQGRVEDLTHARMTAGVMGALRSCSRRSFKGSSRATRLGCFATTDSNTSAVMDILEQC